MPVDIGAKNQIIKIIKLLHWPVTIMPFNCLVICFLIPVNSTDKSEHVSCISLPVTDKEKTSGWWPDDIQHEKREILDQLN